MLDIYALTHGYSMLPRVNYTFFASSDLTLSDIKNVLHPQYAASEPTLPMQAYHPRQSGLPTVNFGAFGLV